MTTQTIPLKLDQAATHVDVAPGGEIILRGKFVCSADASVIDAATTTWPAESPGGASVDSGGLIDLESGGFHMTSRDPAKNEVHAIATGDPAAACEMAGVQSPCLPLRLLPLAQKKLKTVGELTTCLKGGITVEVESSMVPPVAPSVVPYLEVGGALLAVGLLVVVGRARQRKLESTLEGQLLLLASRVKKKLSKADAIVAAPLGPAIEAALKALKGRRVDAASSEGKRVAEVLRRVELRIDASMEQVRADEEQQAADELVREVESALEAAEELAPERKRAEP